MKETIKDLKNRRSCRKYTANPIDAEILDEILETATYAPSGMGMQSPVIVAVTEQKTRDLISSLNARVMGSKGDPFYGAPAVVIVFSKKSMPTYKDDGVLVMANLMNAANALGVDSCYVYRAKEVFEMEEGKELMKQWGLSEEYEGIANCILGYGAEGGKKEAAPRKEDYIIRII